MFRDLTQLSAAGIPTIALVFGNSTAGGAYNPAMCDYSVFVKGRAKVFLGGPPLVKMATGEESTDEELGGAEMHARVSGLADFLAVDELDALRLGRQIVANLNWRKLGPAPARSVEAPLYDAEDLLGLAPADLKVPADMYEVLARVVDGSRFDEFKPLFGTSLVTGWASIHGFPVGILANAAGRALFRGVAEGHAVHPVGQSQRRAAGVHSERDRLHGRQGIRAARHHQARRRMMINAVSNSTVPHVTLQIGASYGAGNYGMCGRAYNPRFVFIWPNSKTAVMGPQQLAGVMSIVSRAAAAEAGRPFDEERRQDAAGLRRKSNRERVAGRVHQRGSTTTASSTRATRAPCWASRLSAALRPKCTARAALAFSACNERKD